MEKRKPIIGFLAGSLDDEYTRNLCRGITYASKRLDIEVVILLGKYIDRDLTQQSQYTYEYQFNTLFSLAKQQKLDGVIIAAGSIGSYTSATRLKEFLDDFRKIPCVLIGDKIEGFLSVNYDNYAGIREGLVYLIEQLGCERIVMMGGSEDNTDSVERKQSFLKILSEYQIVNREDSYVAEEPGQRKVEVYEEYLREHRDIEAVFCVNDYTAMCVYEALSHIGMIPGQDIYIMGYDNTWQGAKASPSLSSVKADAVSLGEHALNLIWMEYNGQRAESIILPTEFVKRESFGVKNDVQDKFFFQRLDRKLIDVFYQDIFYRYVDVNSDRNVYAYFCQLMNLIIEVYEEKNPGSQRLEEIEEYMKNFLEMGAIKFADMDRLLVHVDDIGHLFLEKKNDYESIQNVMKVLSFIYREIIKKEEKMQGKLLEREEGERVDVKSFIVGSMQFDQGSDQSINALLDNLQWLGIKNADLYLYEEPQIHLHRETFMPPNEIYWKASVQNGMVRNVPENESKIQMKELLGRLDYCDEVKAKFALPVFFNENIYGLFFCDMAEEVFNCGEILTGQLGAVAKMVHLLKQNKAIQNAYEKSLSALEENNIQLDTLAKSDGLTGLWNRRGFNELATEFLKKMSDENAKVLVAYIDMNNLKIVNDRYGHEEGDFSIRTIGNILKQMFPQDIVGRIGGDEFALAIRYDREDEGELLVKEIYQSFFNFNEKSLKPYNVMVSVGTSVSDNNQTSLSGLMKLADEKLYVEKQKRSKNVAKAGTK